MTIQEIRLKEGFILREMGGEFHIFEEKEKSNGAVVGMPSLNELGIYLWNALEKGNSLEEITASVCARNQMEEEEALEEIHEFLAKLLHCKIIEIIF